MSEITMYLELRKPCPFSALFDVPHQAEPITARQIAKNFPSFAREMDGSSIENTLLFFYKRNKQTKVYEFLDPESEEDVAELMGVQLYDEEEASAATAARDREDPRHRVLTEAEKAEFREHIADIRDLLAKTEAVDERAHGCEHSN